MAAGASNILREAWKAAGMGMITGDDALFHPGSLLTDEGFIVAPYDIEQQESVGQYRGLHETSGFLNGAASPFNLDYADTPEVHIINGMGVALGDSIIGLTAIEALRDFNPALRALLYRPARAPAYVDALYHLAAGVIADPRWLPWRLTDLPGPAPRIDLGNHLFWPDFAASPMIDFFLRALGVDPARVPPERKANRWLARLCLPAPPSPWASRDYLLFCPTASTPLRSIPPFMHAELVEWLWQRFGCPVLGFGPVDHARYTDIRPYAAETAQFLAWIKHAHFVLTPDSAAVHAAAGFDVPSLAIFTSIEPRLRVRDYPLCRPLHLKVPALGNLHASGRRQDIALIEQAYRDSDWQALNID